MLTSVCLKTVFALFVLEPHLNRDVKLAGSGLHRLFNEKHRIHNYFLGSKIQTERTPPFVCVFFRRPWPRRRPNDSRDGSESVYCRKGLSHQHGQPGAVILCLFASFWHPVFED